MLYFLCTTNSIDRFVVTSFMAFIVASRRGSGTSVVAIHDGGHLCRRSRPLRVPLGTRHSQAPSTALGATHTTTLRDYDGIHTKKALLSLVRAMARALLPSRLLALQG